jgi:hypothetical protein
MRNPVWRIYRLPVAAIRTLHGHPSSRERAPGALKGGAEISAAFVARFLRADIRRVAGSANMAMATKGTNVSPGARRLRRLNRVYHPFFDNGAVGVSGTLTACSNFYYAGHPVLHDWD